MNRISISYTVPLIGLLCTLANTEGYAGDMGPVVAPASPEKIYLGVYGGAGSTNHINVFQYGTAFTPDGPLAVNAIGDTNTPTQGIVGGQFGYQWMDVPFLSTCWSFAPAFELEGYYIGKNNFRAELINNAPVLGEHDFENTFPMDVGVFLTNAVLTLNNSNYQRYHPYVGVGVGGALIRIRDAQSLQEAPVEPGINHYNENPSDKDATFAGQVKAGLNMNICAHTNLFVEYRGLFLGNTHYLFGSTEYPDHPVTTNWAVSMNFHTYSMGAVGLQFSI